MKIAVTGANGFIGRHVLKELANYPVEVFPIVRRKKSFSKGEIINTSQICLDLSELPEDPFRHIGNPDVLIHLAWDGLPNYKSIHHFEQELITQYTFLKSVVEFGLKSLVVTGTCFEYGFQSGPLSEKLKTSPTNPYGFAKDVLRCQLEYLQGVSPFLLTWARLFYLYGEGQAESSLMSQLSKAVLNGEETFKMSGGEQLRDFLPVTEAAKYIVSLAMASVNIGTVNVCSGKPISIRKLVEQQLTENDWRIKLDLGYYSYPEFEPMAFWGEREKLNMFLKNNDRLQDIVN